MKKALWSTAKIANKACIQACGAMIMICMVVSFADVVARMAFGKSVMWAQQTCTWAMLVLAFWGTGAMIMERAHINIDFAFVFARGAIKRALDIINHVAVLAVAVIMLSTSIIYAVYLNAHQVTRLFGTLNVPFWPVIVISLVFGSLVSLVYCIIMLTKVITQRSEGAKGFSEDDAAQL